MGCGGSTTNHSSEKKKSNRMDNNDTDTTELSSKSFYDLSSVKNDGAVCTMSDFRGKVVYIVNTASK